MTHTDRLVLIRRICDIESRRQAGCPWPGDEERRRDYQAELEAEGRRRQLARLAPHTGTADLHKSAGVVRKRGPGRQMTIHEDTRMSRFLAGQTVWLVGAKVELYRRHYGPEVAGDLKVVDVDGDAVIVRCGSVTLPLPVAAKWLLSKPAGWAPSREVSDAASP